MKLLPHVVLAKCICCISAQAAISAVIETGADGVTPGDLVFTSGGSWVGDGIVQPMAPPASETTDFITDFNTGTLHLTEIQGDQTILDPNFSQTHTISAQSGTISLQGNVINNNGNTVTTNRYQLVLGDSVSGITWTADHSSRLHARYGASNKLYQSWIGGIRKIAGTVGMDLTLTWSDITTVTDLSQGASIGVNGTINNVRYMKNSGLSLTQVGDTFVATGTNLGNKNPGSGAGLNSIHGVNLVDPAGLPNIVTQGAGGMGYTATELNDSILSFGEQLHASRLTFNITPNGGGTFDAGTTLVFSFDGFQGSSTYDIAQIPEPKLLGVFTILPALLILYRGRKTNKLPS